MSSKTVTTTARLRLSKREGEYRISHSINGKNLEERAYYTEDREDAEGTFEAEISWYQKMGYELIEKAPRRVLLVLERKLS